MSKELLFKPELGKANAVTFSDLKIACDYLEALPIGYRGRLTKGEGQHWIVSYRFSPIGAKQFHDFSRVLPEEPIR